MKAKKTASKKCDDCGKNKPDVKLSNCPYTDEIDNEKVKLLMCDDCYAERQGMI